jgi:hypothetical protein
MASDAGAALAEAARELQVGRRQSCARTPAALCASCRDHTPSVLGHTLVFWHPARRQDGVSGSPPAGRLRHTHHQLPSRPFAPAPICLSTAGPQVFIVQRLHSFAIRLAGAVAPQATSQQLQQVLSDELNSAPPGPFVERLLERLQQTLASAPALAGVDTALDAPPFHRPSAGSLTAAYGSYQAPGPAAPYAAGPGPAPGADARPVLASSLYPALRAGSLPLSRVSNDHSGGLGIAGSEAHVSTAAPGAAVLRPALQAPARGAGAGSPSVSQPGLGSLAFRHACLALGCPDPGCQLCACNPMRLCGRTFQRKYLVGDTLRAKCGAPIRLELRRPLPDGADEAGISADAAELNMQVPWGRVARGCGRTGDLHALAGGRWRTRGRQGCGGCTRRRSASAWAARRWSWYC